MNRVVCLFFIGAFSGYSLFGQTSLPKTSDGSFKIGTGSSFEASQNKLRPKGNTGDTTISGDLAEAIKVLQANHYFGERLTDEFLVSSSISEMLHSLDPHSNFYPSSQFSELLDGHRSFYSGIGVQLTQFTVEGRSGVFVVSVNEGSPAASAGLRFGDKIMAVDDHDVSGSDTYNVRELIRGVDNTAVRLRIERPNRSVETISVKRSRVEQPSIPDHYMLDETTGYIELSGGFTYTTHTELKLAIASLKKLGMSSLVLDLRGNTGGILEQSIKVADTFLPEGRIIVSQKGRFEFQSRVWRSTKKRQETMPLTVLVDENTASASEIVAGALQDNDRAVIVGTKTFGKGLVQNIIPLPGGTGMALTAARYYTPSGRSIQRDYSATGRYEYFAHKGSSANTKIAYTSKHRKVYGGDGITPDIELKAEDPTDQQLRLIDPIFSFVRKKQRSLNVVTHRIDGIDESIVNEFITFATQNYKNIPQETITTQVVFIKHQLSFYFTAADKGYASATRSLRLSDPQVRAAVKSVRTANSDLAQTINESRNNDAK